MKLRALRTLKREAKSAFTFVSERGAPLHLALAGTGIGRLRMNCTAAVGDASPLNAQTKSSSGRRGRRNRFSCPTLAPSPGSWTGRGLAHKSKRSPRVRSFCFSAADLSHVFGLIYLISIA